MLTTRQAIEAGFTFQETAEGGTGFWTFRFGDGYALNLEPLIFGQMLVALYQHDELLTEKVPVLPRGEGMPPDAVAAAIRAIIDDDDRGSTMYFDRQGKPIGVVELDRLLSDPAYKRVAETTIGDWWVSTVWLGINHNFVGDDPMPIIFETMPFYRGDDADDLHSELRDLDNEVAGRYATEADAIAGHDRFCVHLRTLIANLEMADELKARAAAEFDKRDGDQP